MAGKIPFVRFSFHDENFSISKVGDKNKFKVPSEKGKNFFFLRRRKSFSYFVKRNVYENVKQHCGVNGLNLKQKRRGNERRRQKKNVVNCEDNFRNFTIKVIFKVT